MGGLTLEFEHFILSTMTPYGINTETESQHTLLQTENRYIKEVFELIHPI